MADISFLSDEAKKIVVDLVVSAMESWDGMSDKDRERFHNNIHTYTGMMIGRLAKEIVDEWDEKN